MIRSFGIIFISISAILSPASAQTSLQIRPAWGNKDRVGRWNAILVRASDLIPRNVILQLISPEPGGFATILEEHVAIGPTPATLEILSPVHTSTWRQTIAVLRDSGTGRLLAQYPPVGRRPRTDVPAVGPHTLFVGMTGTAASLELLGGSLTADFGYLAGHLLPRSPSGYDSLDVLLLNRARFAGIDLDQQRAMLDWVRAGGSILFTPGDDTPGRDSPLAGALSCRIGDLKELDLPAQTLSDLHLSRRFAHVGVRSLDPVDGAEALPIFKGAVTGFSRRLGLGRILVLPFDIRTIEADDPADGPAVIATWQSILAALVRVPKPPGETPRFASPYNGFMSESPEQFREGAATATVCDFLSPPSARAPRQWPHVTLVLLGLFAIVGPLDCFFLKITGQSPWSWTTMVGWIACFVLGGLYGASLLSRPPTVFATLRLIDQCDDATVATTDLIASRLSKATQVEPSPPDSTPGWWEPALPGSVMATGLTPTRADLSFHQSDEFCVPTKVPSSVETRFFRRQSLVSSAPAVSAHLKVIGDGSSARIRGTVQNLLATPLKDLRLRSASGVVVIAPDASGIVAAGQTITIDVAAGGEGFSPGKYEGRYQSFGDWGSRTDAAAVREQDLWAVVPDLAARRSLRIDGLFESNAGVACLYAQVISPAPTAKPAGAADVPVQSHEWLRAVISLAREPI